MIPQQNLSKLSNRLANRGGRRIPEAVLERDYCIAWFLISLSRTPLRSRIAFKGGTALKHCYIGDYRFSEDLDFTLVEKIEFDVIRKELDSVFSEALRSAGIKFSFVRQDPDSHRNSYTFYIGYEGPLPSVSASKEIKVDITIREKVIFPLENIPVLKAYPEYSDLPDNANILIYSLQEIAVEKVVALMDKARNEPRDLYDLWYLITEDHISLENLADAIKTKWDFRGKPFSEAGSNFLSKEARYDKLWSIRLSAQMTHLPKFDTVYRIVKRAFRQAGLLNK